MAIFNGTQPSNQGPTTVTNSATQIYNTTSYNSINFPTGAALRDITVINTGTVTCFVGTSSVTATTGVPLRSGEQLTIQGSHVQGESGNTSWNLYAITASGSTSVDVSLATQVAVA